MSARSLRTERGFTFIEVLVVMGIIAVLVGMGVGVYMIAVKKAPEVRTDALLAKMRANIDAWRGANRTYPPSDLQRLPLLLQQPGLKIGRPNPDNVTNWGNESLYQSMRIPGFTHDPDLSDADLGNNDEDALDKPLARSGEAALLEIKDAWDSPLVYFVEGDYAKAEKDPPVYLNRDGAAVNPKPYRAESGGFAQPGSYQLYSMGPDGQPNTPDDRLGWGAR